MSPYTGFTDKTIKFLKGLKKNNTKKWMDAHKAEYQEHLIEPAREFVVAMGERLKTISPNIQADPRVNGSIRRMARDIRFAKDKTPYKTHLDIMFVERGDRRCSASSLVFRLEANQLTLGTGVYEFSKESLSRYRDAIAHETKGAELVKVITKTKQAGYDLHGVHYKRVPRGYDPEHPRADLLLHNGLYAGVELTPLPEFVCSKSLLTECLRHYRKLLPFHRWLDIVS